LDNSSLKNRKQFTGKEQDEGTNLYYFGARYYDSEIGRFVSVDPIYTLIGTKAIEYYTQERAYYFLANPQNLNNYSYVLNNPLIYTDPTGQMAEAVGLTCGPYAAICAGAIKMVEVTIMVIIVVNKAENSAELNNERANYKVPRVDLNNTDANSIPQSHSSAGESEPEAKDLSEPQSNAGESEDNAKKNDEAKKKADADATARKELGDKIKDINQNPKNWEKIGEKLDNYQRKGQKSIRELWRNKKTGQTLEKHRLENINTGKPVSKNHPHYKTPSRW